MEWAGHYEQGGSKHDVKFQNMSISGDGHIQGGGHDPVGDFSLNGHINGNNDVEFVKQYKLKHAVSYKGKLDEDGTIKGQWELQGMHGGFEITMKTKRWIGSHLAAGGHALGNSSNKLVVSLDFDEKTIGVKGIGHDEKGSFSISGVTPTEFEKKVITLEKIYFNNPSVKIYYAGVIANQGGHEVIRGAWHQPGHETGDFSLQKQA